MKNYFLINWNSIRNEFLCKSIFAINMPQYLLSWKYRCCVFLIFASYQHHKAFTKLIQIFSMILKFDIRFLCFNYKNCKSKIKVNIFSNPHIWVVWVNVYVSNNIWKIDDRIISEKFQFHNMRIWFLHDERKIIVLNCSYPL